MNIIQQSVAWFVPPPPNTLELLELAGRVAYKSEDKITPHSNELFVKNILNARHESVIEHVSASMRIITDRGVSHELVRHRLCSFTQESTRYCNYGKAKFDGVTFIEPVDFPNEECYTEWIIGMCEAERRYLEMLKLGATPQLARSVLPNSTKTELIMTANLRQWRYVLKLRTTPEVHPQMRALMLDAQKMFRETVPLLFD